MENNDLKLLQCVVPSVTSVMAGSRALKRKREEAEADGKLSSLPINCYYCYYRVGNRM